MRPHASGRGNRTGCDAVSLDENPAAGNAGDAPARIVALPSPSPALRLFWCRLDPAPHDLATLGATLSPSEWTRAGRFGRAALRERYIIGRGLLRTIVGGALGVEPGRVEITRGRRGRPQLAPPHTLDFNISHTLGVALVGLVEGARIGVDVEHAERSINATGIARKFMTENERRALESMPPDAARRRVLELWTCKEAMSKATGDALTAPFGEIDVDVEAHRALRSGPAPYEPARWALHRAAVPEDYFATVAVWRGDAALP
jgi:4'-phosphopantetheinyl transferase